VQGDAVEDLDLGAVLDDEALDDVEAVQFDPGRGEFGQIPAAWRRRAAGPAAAVQRTPAGEDAIDGSQRRQRGNALLVQRLPDGGGPIAPRSPWAKASRVFKIRSSTAVSVRRVLRGAREWSDQSTRSRRWPFARSTQWATVAMPTPN